MPCWTLSLLVDPCIPKPQVVLRSEHFKFRSFFFFFSFIERSLRVHEIPPAAFIVVYVLFGIVKHECQYVVAHLVIHYRTRSFWLSPPVWCPGIATFKHFLIFILVI